jgi:hypothetical protein
VTHVPGTSDTVTSAASMSSGNQQPSAEVKGEAAGRMKSADTTATDPGLRTLHYDVKMNMCTQIITDL